MNSCYDFMSIQKFYEFFVTYRKLRIPQGLSFPGPFRGFPPEHIPGKASLFENSEGSPTSSPDHTQSIYINGEDEEGDTLRELERLKLDDSNLDTGVANVKELQVMSRSLGHWWGVM